LLVKIKKRLKKGEKKDKKDGSVRPFSGFARKAAISL